MKAKYRTHNTDLGSKPITQKYKLYSSEWFERLTEWTGAGLFDKGGQATRQTSGEE